MSPRLRSRLVVALLLLAFLAQAAYVCGTQPLRDSELGYVQVGEQVLKDTGLRRPHFVSPLVALTAALPVAALGRSALDDGAAESLRWPARLPFIAIGLLLGGSLWYVARRLFGVPGGLVALALYVFSAAPAYSARISPNVLAMLGVFGVIYVSIALAHTFYPDPNAHGLRGFVSECRPRWKRVLLLVVAATLALGAAPTTALALPLALGFMLYVAPQGRRWLAPVVLTVATGVALALLWALHGFHGEALAQQVRLSYGVVSSEVAWRQLQLYPLGLLWLTRYPALLLFLLLALSAWLGARRVRYFGNTAPLIVLAVFTAGTLAGLAPDVLAYGAFPLRVLPFVFVFLGGVAADLFETEPRRLMRAVVIALLLSHVIIAFRDLRREAGPHPPRSGPAAHP